MQGQSYNHYDEIPVYLPKNSAKKQDYYSTELGTKQSGKRGSVKMGQVELSFVIPAYNEEFYIEDTLGTLDLVVKEKSFQYEIVVVDDGSRDKTFAKALQYSKRNGHVKVIRYARNVGKRVCH